MEQYSYFSVDSRKADRCVTDRPLAINCTGTVSLKQDFTSSTQKGRNDFYIIYMINGEMKLSLGENEYFFKSGQFVIISPHTPYRYSNLNGSHVDYYWIHFTGSHAKKLIENSGLSFNTPVEISVQDNIIRTFHRLFDEFVQPDELFEQSCSAHLTTLCVRFARAVRGALKNDNKAWMLAETFRYMNEHYKDNLTVSELAERANISCGYFRVLFREVTGETPVEYLTKLRLKNACMLLYQTNLSIKEIASQVGFSDQLYFSRVFSKYYGMSPLKFRRADCE